MGASHSRVKRIRDSVECEEEAISSKKSKVVDDDTINEESCEDARTGEDKLHEIVSINLTCHLCAHLPRHLPLMICDHNHLTCVTCYERQSSPLSCLLCKHRLREHSNSSLISSLLQTVLRRCRWSDNGCHYQHTLHNMIHHEKICSLQSVQCSSCRNFFPLSSFHHHDLHCFHQEQILSAPLQSMKIGIKSSDVVQVAVAHQEDVFYVKLERIPARSIWLISVVGQMIPEDCLKFTVSVRVSKNHDDQDRSFSFSGPPSSIVLTDIIILKEGNCLVLTERAMKNILNTSDQETNDPEDGFIFLTLTIANT